MEYRLDCSDFFVFNTDNMEDLYFSVENLFLDPVYSGLSFDDATGVLQGRATEVDCKTRPQPFELKCVATDNLNKAAEQPFTLAISCGTRPPTSEPTANPTLEPLMIQPYFPLDPANPFPTNGNGPASITSSNPYYGNALLDPAVVGGGSTTSGSPSPALGLPFQTGYTILKTSHFVPLPQVFCP